MLRGALGDDGSVETIVMVILPCLGETLEPVMGFVKLFVSIVGTLKGMELISQSWGCRSLILVCGAVIMGCYICQEKV
mgnify:FL=1